MIRCSVIAFLCVGSSVAANKYPEMSGNISSPECSDAFLLSKSMFSSKAPSLYAPLVIPEDIRSTFALGAYEYDISGGMALTMSGQSFKKIVLEKSPRNSLYWSINEKSGGRLFLTESLHSWRGDTYSIYFSDVAKNEDDVIVDIQKGKSTAFLSGLWRPPVIFEGLSKEIWFIDVGQPYQIMPDWTVYKVESDGFRQSCTITFRPKGESGIELMPKAVQKFARLVDRSVGDGIDEGTLQLTAQSKLRTQHRWANAALRPWALSEKRIYNSTEEVEAGLLEWSKAAPSFHRLYKDILIAYPVAEKSLTNYYMHQFNLPKERARELAQWIMNIIFRGSYMFHRSSDTASDNHDDNPWWKISSNDPAPAL